MASVTGTTAVATGRAVMPSIGKWRTVASRPEVQIVSPRAVKTMSVTARAWPSSVCVPASRRGFMIGASGTTCCTDGSANASADAAPATGASKSTCAVHVDDRRRV